MNSDIQLLFIWFIDENIHSIIVPTNDSTRHLDERRATSHGLR